MDLVEGLRLVESIAVLRAHHVRVQVLLRAPGGPVEEVHRRKETARGDRAQALHRHLHRVVVVYLVHVGDLLAQVGALLEPRVREGLPHRGGRLSVMDTRVAQRDRALAVLVLDRMHRRVRLRNL